jgi:beta-phosphoglucomutase
MLKAVIFDFDGVLVDSELLHYQAFNHILSPLGVNMSTQQYYDQYLGLSDEELLRLLDKQNNLNLSEQRLRKLFKEKALAFKELSSAQAAVIAGVPQFLNMLYENKIPMAICSGALLPEIEMILQGANLRHYFDVIVSAEQVQKGKPDPEGFLLAIEKLNAKLNTQISPRECIVIEDSHWGLEAAKSAGMHPVAVTNSYSADQLKPSDKIVANLGKLSLSDLHALCV